jgi:hypothetical protein
MSDAATPPGEGGPVQVSGRYHEVSSQAACIHAAVEHWGKAVPYHHVAGLTGTAFCCGLSKDSACAACRADPTCDHRLGFAGHALGFTVVASPERGGEAWAEFCRRAREAVQTGGVVLCASWPSWSVVTRWSEDPLERSLNAPRGLEGTCRAQSDSRSYILQPTAPSLTPVEAFLEALRFGASLSAGEYETEQCAFGDRLYGLWLDQLHNDTFCPHGREDWCGCAERAASRAVGAHLSAVRFLSRAHSMPIPARARGFVDGAARAYAAMARELTPYTTGSGLKDIWSVPHKQGHYVSSVKHVAELHRVAAEQLSCAAGGL